MPGTGRLASSGAYGIALRGLEEAADLLVSVAPDAPVYHVSSELGAADGARERVGEQRAELQLRSGGQIVIDRGRSTVVFRVPHRVRPDELVHPYLAPAAAVIGRWLGRESMHAGAFAVGGRAWGLLGGRTAGKSSTLGWLTRLGADVVCDDMLIVDGRLAVAGPRSLDLREDAAKRLDAGRAIGVTGARERWRLELGTVPEAVELGGWFVLEWGDEIAVRRLGAAERVAALAPHRALRMPPARPDGLLQMASLPAWSISRPRRWDSLPEAAACLLEVATATPTAGA